jgi:hypothetical protein
MTELGDFGRLKRGTAALAAVLVKTLNETDPTFQERFLKHLETAYDHFKNGTSPYTEGEGDKVTALELLSWTRQMITGWDRIKGQGSPFLDE